MTRLLLVGAGGDRHRFDRLVGWAERWAEGAPEWDVQVQYGHSRRPAAGHGFPFCDHDRLAELVGEADVVLCDASTAVIAAARRSGRRPIVVPRDPTRGEHADDRQQVFARRLARAGVADLAETEDAFLAAAVTIAFLPRPRAASDDLAVPPGVLRVGAIVEELAGRRRRSSWRGRSSSTERTIST